MKKFIKIALLTILCVCSFAAVIGCGGDSKFTVTFDGNGGTLVSGNQVQTVESTSQIVVPVYEKEGYDFIGWDTIISQIDKDTTVKAQWKQKPFKVIFDGNGGTLVSGELEQTIYSASELIIPTFAKKGHTLEWDTDISKITSATTVKANWIVNQYLLTFDLNGGEVDSAIENGKTITYGQPIGTLPTPTKEGYDFDHWQIGSSIITKDTVWEFDADMVAKAEYLREAEYVIKYDLGGGQVETNPYKYSKSTPTFTLNNPTRTGYTFKGWLDQNLNQVFDNMTIEKGSTGERSFKAEWQANQYTITFDAKDGTCTTPDKKVTFDAAVGTLPTCQKVDYEFLGWYLDGKKIDEDTIWNIDSDKILVADYLKADEYSITYILGGGTEQTNPNKYTEFSIAITLNNPTREGYEFIGWTSDDIVEPTMSVVIETGTTGNLTFTANWKANKYLLTFNADNGTIADKFKDGIVVIYGEEIGELPLPVKTGFEFVQWNVATDEINEKTVWTYLEDKVAVASYVKEPEYSITYYLQGGVGAANPSSYRKSDPTFTLNNPTKTGYDFIGWTSDTIVSPQISVAIESGTTGNLTFTANWYVKSFVIALDAAGGICEKDKTIVTYDRKIGELPTPKKEGYKFIGWYLNDVKVGEDTIWTYDQAIKLVAKYKVDLRVQIVLSCTFRNEIVTATVNGLSVLPPISVVEGQTLQGLLPNKNDIVFMDPDEYYFYAWVNVNGVKVTETTKITAENFPDLESGVIKIIIKCQSVNTKFY